MTTKLTARCPACNTTFHITPQQLQVAEGRVRCGQCSTLFDAKPSSTEPLLPPTGSMPPLTSAEKALSMTDDTLFTLDSTLPTIRPKQRHLLSSLLIILLSLLLVCQVLWFNQQYWRTSPFLLPLYEQFNLSPWQNIKQIRNEQLVVQPHPEFQDAIRVSLRLKNTAPIPQPFPRLKLTFSDLKGRVVASQIFTPKTYLDLERFDPKSMPSDTPLQFQLDLLAPSRRAVSYQLELFPAS